MKTVQNQLKSIDLDVMLKQSDINFKLTQSELEEALNNLNLASKKVITLLVDENNLLKEELKQLKHKFNMKGHI